MISEIDSATSQQATGVKEVNTAIAQMSEATQQNSTSANQTSTSANELSSQACDLRQLVQNLMCIIEGAGASAQNHDLAISTQGEKSTEASLPEIRLAS
jgi:methyl-accepting chemotaxis protein